MDLISYAEALERIRREVTPLDTEPINLPEAVGRVVAEAVQARTDVPRWANSAMDGYAVCTADLHGDPPYELPVTATVAAGSEPGWELGPHQAVRIYTGAPVPAGADAVVRQEDTDRVGDRVRIWVRPRPGDHIRRAGEDVRDGTVVLRVGQVLTPGAVALAAAVGHAQIRVFRVPRVSLAASGDELVPPGRPLHGGQIWESNTYYLMARLRSMGLVPRRFPVLADDPEAMVRAIGDWVDECDVLITTGGVSVGDRDFMEAAAERLGARLLFHGVAIKPGKPVLAARLGNAWLFALPGNPASTMVTFELLVYPCLWWLQGVDRDLPQFLTGFLENRAENRGDREWFLRASVRVVDGRWLVRPLPLQGSHLVSTQAETLALARIAPRTRVPAGEPISFAPLYGLPFDLVGTET